MSWISVKDRLPEEDHNVLICMRDPFSNANMVLISHLRDFNGDLKFADSNFNSYSPFNDPDTLPYFENVLYWQPLPEPPKDK